MRYGRNPSLAVLNVVVGAAGKEFCVSPAPRFGLVRIERRGLDKGLRIKGNARSNDQASQGDTSRQAAAVMIVRLYESRVKHLILVKGAAQIILSPAGLDV